MQAGTSANPPQRPIEIIRANSDGEEVGGEWNEEPGVVCMKMVTLRNVGSTFDKIQQAVREELERTIVVAPSSPLRAAGPEKRPLASSLPTAAKRVRVSNVAEVVTIEDSDEEQLPEDLNVSAPNSEPTANRKRLREGCPHCGFKTKSYLIFNLHVAAHTSDHSFLCSLCGTRWLDWEKRNIHEINAHFFLRQVVDKKRKEAIRIDATFRSILKNVGKNIEEVQQKALTSGSQMFFDPKEEPANEEVARRTSPRKRASVSPRKLCTVRPTANDAHLTEDAVQRLNRSVPPVPPPLPEPAACSHESLEPAQIVDLQEDLECALENPSFSVWSLSALLSAFAATRSKEVINVSPGSARPSRQIFVSG
ncbi:hypothetical protein M3Y99_01575800 [Aphelenchoides fujianensis]|nr:hypothetical protein M3Y99_01575800 [Aphelenchoides fujianensis]